MSRVVATVRLVVAMLASAAPAAAAEPGRAIYRSGEATPEVTLHLAGATTALSASTLPCVNCHGLQGEGRSEGGLTIPAIGRDRLRGRYGAEQLLRAVSLGIAADGHPLLGMPRYDLAPGQLDALHRYLAVLGSEGDADPGITADTFTVGSVLPLASPQGQLIAETLQRSVDAINDQGGVYGRRLRLVVADGSADGERAVRALLAREPTALLVASMGVTGTPGTAPRDAAGPVPVIAPLSIPRDAALGSAEPVYYTLPSLEDEVRGARDLLEQRELGSVLIFAGDPSATDAARLAQQLLGGVAATSLETIPAAASFIRERAPGALLWLGAPAELAPLLATAGVERWQGTIVVPAYLADPALLALPPALRGRIHVVAPDASVEGGVAATLARAAIAVTAAALRRCGRSVNRAVLSQALDRAGELQVDVGSPALDFAAGKIGTRRTVAQCMGTEPPGRGLSPSDPHAGGLNPVR
jgi:mono/diheme cytochrome c family protein